MEKKLEVKNLTVSFRTQSGKVQAVRNISFDLYKGETLAIVGESGSGKSVTSRAIMGILAGNSIVEGGKILYDGQDLLKITEDDFHKIRGDKIAMIFQDPLSSLNPIMRVGKQLTEAMLLKSKSSQRNARLSFNSMLSRLNHYLDEADKGNAENQKENAERCRTFDRFCIESTRIEGLYNQKVAELVEMSDDVSDALFLISKKMKVDFARLSKTIKTNIKFCTDPDVLEQSDETSALLQYFSSTKIKSEKDPELTRYTEMLNRLTVICDNAMKKKKPDFFTLGYYKMKNPGADLDKYTVDELDKMTREYLDNDFMLAFIADGAVSLERSRNESIAKKEEMMPLIKTEIEFFKRGGYTFNEACLHADALIKKVKAQINKLEIIKNSTEYTFESSLLSAINRYFSGIKSNPKIQARYDRQKAKWDKLDKSGNTPSWKVVPPMLIDTELAKNNIIDIIETLYASFENAIAEKNNYNAEKEMVAFVDYMKDKASEVVYKVTKKTAKAKAIKLLEEVGIPEPRIRYNQYPFEFSGGMRQRVVIAIALAANPDILICDEPTTALDVTIQAQILDLINKLKEERHLSIIFITHDLGVVANMADKIAVMYAGKIVEFGTCNDIFYDPRHPYTWALLSSMPDLDTKDRLEAIPGTPPNMIYPPVGDAFAQRNKYAMKIDFEKQPPMFRISDTHSAATWLLHPDAPNVAMPEIVSNRIERMKTEVSKNG